MRQRDMEDGPTDGFSRRLPLCRRRLLEAVGAGSAAIASVGGGATLAAGRPGGGGDDVEVKEVPRREPHETTTSGDDSTVAVGPKSRTYEAFTVTPGELSDESSGRATDFVKNEEDGEVIEVGTGFDGLSFTDSLRDTDGDGAAEFGLVPGDPQVAVGADRAVAAINSDIAAFDLRNGKEVFQVRLEDLFRPVLPPGPLFDEFLVFDPRARFDPADGGHYLVSCVEYNLDDDRGYMLLAVSKTADPTGSWTLYKVPPIVNEGLVDYAALGYDGQAVYLTQNRFAGARLFAEATLVILDKTDLYAGRTVDASHFRTLRNPDGQKAFTVQPIAAREGGGTAHLANSRFGSADTLTLWTLTDPTGTPSLSNQSVPVAPYSNPPAAEQPETDGLVDTGDTRLLRLALDEADGTLWTAHSIADGGHAAARWYQLTPDAQARQSGTYRLPGASVFFPAVEARQGEAVFVVSVSGPDTFPRMDVLARTADFTEGEIEDRVVVQAGAGPYDYGADEMRWGDYNGVSIHPDTGDYWTVTQFSPSDAAAGSDADYDTRVAEIDLP